MIICLDAGHGGIDIGEVNNKPIEVEITKKIINLCVNKLSCYDVKIITTRGSLENRIKTANDFKANYFISIHLNSSKKGSFESYVKDNPPLLNEYNQKIIHDEIFSYLKQFKVINAGAKMFDFYIVKHTKMPSLLLELLSVNNLKDCDLLKDEIFLDGLCESIVKGIVSCLKLNFAPKIIEE